MISRLPSVFIDNNKPITMNNQCQANELFAINGTENNKDCFPLNFLCVQREQKTSPRKE